MNATQTAPNQAATAAAPSELARLLQKTFTPQDLMDGDNLDRLERIAIRMSEGRMTVPEHLRNNVGDCMAIAMQAMLWNMDPFAVAQKTHIVSGRLGYEAQLVNAVLQNSGAIRGLPYYEYRGEGPCLECRVGCIPRGESDIRWNEWLAISAITTKNSPLWKTNPKQQMGYLQVKNWARAYAPGAILGVYTTDELQDDGLPPPPSARAPAVQPSPQALPAYEQAAFTKNLPAWTKLVADGKKSAQDLLATLSTKATFTEEQKAQILRLRPAQAATAPAPAPAPEPTPAPSPAADDGHDDFRSDMDAAEGQQ